MSGLPERYTASLHSRLLLLMMMILLLLLRLVLLLLSCLKEDLKEYKDRVCYWKQGVKSIRQI